jgi:hypothetical protein
MSQIIHGGELLFDESHDAYTWNGNYVPGVTTILQVISKPMLIQWSANMASAYFFDQLKSGRSDLEVIAKESKTAHRRKMEASGDSGTNVHQYAESYFKKQTLPILETDEAKKGVEAFHKWLDAHDVKVIASERRVFSKEFYYAGTCDFVAKIDGVLGVGDIKTSSGIYPEMRFQTAAYQQALEEEKGFRFPARFIIRFDKKSGQFEFKTFTDFELDFEGFKAALNLHRVLQEITK